MSVAASLFRGRLWPQTRPGTVALLEIAFPAAVAVAVIIGWAVRAFYSLSSSFPLNDGGLFYAMTRDLQQNGYLPPSATSYNHASIPFSYPPLGFYAAGLLADLTPLSLTDSFRVLPLAATCLTLPAFYLLARRMLQTRTHLIVAVVAFALVPRSFLWLLMGGGITRSIGLLFAILALHHVYLLYTRRSWRFLPGAAILATLTLLSHPETAWFLAVSVGLFAAAFGRHRFGLVASVAFGVGALVLASPWWAMVLLDHGSEPFRAAFGSGGSILSDAETRRSLLTAVARAVSTSEPFYPVIGTLGLLGGLRSAATGRFFLPAWWLAIILTDARAFQTFTTIPVSMLAGVGVVEVLMPALSRAGPAVLDGIQPRPQAFALRSQPAVALVLAVLFGFAVWGALQRRPGTAGEGEYLVGLGAADRAAMGWVAANAAADDRFLVVPDSTWETARVAEWFPVLANRRSVATVQGTEWLPDRVFTQRIEDFYEALDCGYRTDACLDEWQLRTGLTFTHVYVPVSRASQCCATLVDSLRSDPRYSIVYDGRGATIFAWSPDSPAASSGR